MTDSCTLLTQGQMFRPTKMAMIRPNNFTRIIIKFCCKKFLQSTLTLALWQIRQNGAMKMLSTTGNSICKILYCHWLYWLANKIVGRKVETIFWWGDKKNICLYMWILYSRLSSGNCLVGISLVVSRKKFPIANKKFSDLFNDANISSDDIIQVSWCWYWSMYENVALIVHNLEKRHHNS